jgi:hypothetical protein
VFDRMVEFPIILIPERAGVLIYSSFGNSFNSNRIHIPAGNCRLMIRIILIPVCINGSLFTLLLVLDKFVVF